MSTTTDIHPVAAQYLRRLRREARRLPRSTRAELVADIEAHLTEATTPDMSEADVLTELDRLGEPAEIVGAHQPALTAASRQLKGTHEWAAIFLLLFGGFIFGVGWIFGLILLWSSNVWRTRDKWIGTLLLPGGLAGVLLYMGTALIGSSSGGSCVSPVRPASIDGHPITAMHHPAIHCTGNAGTGPDILAIALIVVLLATPILTAIYLARKADNITPATA